MDRLSELPDEILHQIIARIPYRHAKVAAKLTVLSRRWKHIWLSYPILEMDNVSVDPLKDEFVRCRLEAAPPGSCKLEGFSAAATKKFTAQACRLNIEEIQVSLYDLLLDHDDGVFRLLHDTLAMVSNREPEKICIRVMYVYPITLAPLINNRRLRVLDLECCYLEELSSYEFEEMIHLQELRLSRFSIDDSTLNRLIASAPSLEILKLEMPKDRIIHKRLQICNHPKLKSILFHSLSVEQLIQIKDAPSLETLEFLYSTRAEPHFEISTSPLTTLPLLKIGNVSSRQSRCLGNLISATSGLEELELADISGAYELNIINPALLRATLRRGHGLNSVPLGEKSTIRIDAPKLVQFNFHESMECLPSFSFDTDVEAAECFKAFLSIYDAVITQKEFKDLKCFLAELRPQFRFLRVWFRHDTDHECSFDRDQIQDDAPAVVVNNVYFNSFTLLTLPGVKAFFDGLFWSCRPLNILIVGNYDNDRTWSRGLKMMNKLFARRSRRHECPVVACRCWRRKLKDFDTFYVTEENTVIKLKEVEFDASKVARVLFKLTWYTN